MENGLSPRIGKSTLVILAITVLAITVLILSGLANATYYVKSGHSIQSVIDAANPGQIIEVQNGTFHERVNITKDLPSRAWASQLLTPAAREAQ